MLPLQNPTRKVPRQGVGNTNFRNPRINQRLSQSALAKRARITQAMVSKVEAGRDVQLSTLLALANVLGLDIALLTAKQSFLFRRETLDQSQSLLEQFCIHPALLAPTA